MLWEEWFSIVGDSVASAKEWEIVGAVDTFATCTRVAGDAAKDRTRRWGNAVAKTLIVVLLSEHLRFEPVQRGGERDAGLSSLTRGQHPKRRIHGQPLRVVGVLVARQAAIDRLAEEIHQRELPVAPAARIGEVSLGDSPSQD